MNFHIHYVTEYAYDGPVVDNLNALRVHPAKTSTQRSEDVTLRTDPETRLHRHVDYFGTEVVEFGISEPHESLTIDLRARVRTEDPREPPSASWGALDMPSYREAAGEYGFQTEPVPASDRFAELRAVSRATSPLATVRLLAELIPDEFTYQPGVTYVGSTVADLLEGGAGVCQDFVHLGLMLLRDHGIAARYASGYYWAAHDGSEDSIEVNTHAWIEALLPAAGGGGPPQWVAIDPTNRGLAGPQYVKIGHGRHYPDVPPIKGVYRGGGRAHLRASVRMTRVNGSG